MTKKLASNRLPLATAPILGQTPSRYETKVKCKYHNFIPELLFDKMKEAVSWPTRKKLKGKSIKRKMKLEEDVHFDNIKFCASGSVVLPGTSHNFKKVKDFSKFFERIEEWIPRKYAG